MSWESTQTARYRSVCPWCGVGITKGSPIALLPAPIRPNVVVEPGGTHVRFPVSGRVYRRHELNPGRRKTVHARCYSAALANTDLSVRDSHLPGRK